MTTSLIENLCLSPRAKVTQQTPVSSWERTNVPRPLHTASAVCVVQISGLDWEGPGGSILLVERQGPSSPLPKRFPLFLEPSCADGFRKAKRFGPLAQLCKGLRKPRGDHDLISVEVLNKGGGDLFLMPRDAGGQPVHVTVGVGVALAAALRYSVPCTLGLRFLLESATACVAKCDEDRVSACGKGDAALQALTGSLEAPLSASGLPRDVTVSRNLAVEAARLLEKLGTVTTFIREGGSTNPEASLQECHARLKKLKEISPHADAK